MEVRILVGAQDAYACIKTTKTSLDIRLAHGKSPVQSLIAVASEWEEKAAYLIRHALIARDAAEELHRQAGHKINTSGQ